MFDLTTAQSDKIDDDDLAARFDQQTQGFLRVADNYARQNKLMRWLIALLLSGILLLGGFMVATAINYTNEFSKLAEQTEVVAGSNSELSMILNRRTPIIEALECNRVNDDLHDTAQDHRDAMQTVFLLTLLEADEDGSISVEEKAAIESSRLAYTDAEFFLTNIGQVQDDCSEIGAD